MIHGLFVRVEIDAADAQVVPTPNKTRAEIQRMPVRIHRFLAAPAVRQSSAQSVPEQSVIWHRVECGLKTIDCFVVLA